MVEKIPEKTKQKVMEIVKKAGSQEYKTSWDEKGRPVSKKKSEIKKGKKSRAAGLRFEARVREDLEKMGWVVDKWTNTVDYNKLKLVPAKRKYNPFTRVMALGTGFPDFVAIKPVKEKEVFNEIGEPINSGETKFEVVGVEVKSNGYLDKIEKGMCMWLLKNKIFSKILIARKTQQGRKIVPEYIDFKKKYGKKFLDDLS